MGGLMRSVSIFFMAPPRLHFGHRLASECAFMAMLVARACFRLKSALLRFDLAMARPPGRFLEWVFRLVRPHGKPQNDDAGYLHSVERSRYGEVISLALGLLAVAFTALDVAQDSECWAHARLLGRLLGWRLQRLLKQSTRDADGMFACGKGDVILHREKTAAHSDDQQVSTAVLQLVDSRAGCCDCTSLAEELHIGLRAVFRFWLMRTRA